MLAPEPICGIRVVASAEALDAIAWPDETVAIRLAPDDLFVLGAVPAEIEEALVEEESGFVGWWLTHGELAERVLEHVDWPLPASRPKLAQGLIAGVPAKLWLADDQALLFCAAAYAHELMERLG